MFTPWKCSGKQYTSHFLIEDKMYLPAEEKLAEKKAKSDIEYRKYMDYVTLTLIQYLL